MQQTPGRARPTILKNADCGRLGRIASGNALVATNDEPEPGVTSCVACIHCGGETYPDDNGLCKACRGLAATWARVYPLGRA